MRQSENRLSWIQITMDTTHLTTPVAELDENTLENLSRAPVRNPTSLVTEETPCESEFQIRKKNGRLQLDRNIWSLEESCDERENIKKVEKIKEKEESTPKSGPSQSGSKRSYPRYWDSESLEKKTPKGISYNIST